VKSRLGCMTNCNNVSALALNFLKMFAKKACELLVL